MAFPITVSSNCIRARYSTLFVTTIGPIIPANAEGSSWIFSASFNCPSSRYIRSSLMVK
ncbi:Uncharacterised protein [Vibrio cholerae]|nr:Uncharacterised protein [Vibrio cholerae]CSB72375.1 Uncharacterised protein [Vibrio cholerae]